MYLIVFNIFGLILNFIGTVFLSIGLLRSGEEILDEEATYFDANPYTTKNALGAQPYYNVGFRILLFGFAINIAVQMQEILPATKELQTTFLAVALGLVGLLITSLFQGKKRNSHLLYKNHLNASVYLKRAKTVLEDATEKSTQEIWQQEANFNNYKGAKSDELTNGSVGQTDKKARKILSFTKKLRAAKDFPEFLELLTKHLESIQETTPSSEDDE